MGCIRICGWFSDSTQECQLLSGANYDLLSAEKLNFMPTKIEEKTQELCETIIAQPEMASIRKRIDLFLADKGANSQYEAVMNKGSALHEKQHRGQPLDGAE